MGDRLSIDGRESLWERIDRRAAMSPRALMAADERGVHLSFAAYRDDALSVAAGLAAAGVDSGMVVAWQMPTWIETLVLMGALARLDCTQVPVLPSYGTREIEHAVRTTGATVIIATASFGDDRPAERVRQSVPATVRTLLIDDRVLPHGDASRLAPMPPRDGDPVRWIFHTSGTTAEPKGVLHTDATTFAAGRAWSVPAEITAADRMSLLFPVAHIGGLSLLNIALDIGVGMVVLERFIADAAVEVLEREGVTLAGAGPAFFLGYLDVQRRHPERRILPAVRVFPSGGAPKSPALHARLIEEIGVGMASNYGLTECPNSTGTPMDAPPDKVAHTEGKASPGVELSVRDGDGAQLPVGTAGELWVRGPQLFRGYVDATLDAEVFDHDGFFRTGDVATIDDEGFVRIVGRMKDIIIRKGENISAKEVEDLLHEHPKVAEAAVIGLPDDARGELCCAVVIPRDRDDPPTLAELSRFLRDRGLMIHKVPERLEVVESFPRASSYGKILKAELRHRFG